MLIGYEFVKKYGVKEKVIFEVFLWRGIFLKIVRVFKFLVFEMLEEFKKLKDDEMRKIFKEFFELGRKIEIGEYVF